MSHSATHARAPARAKGGSSPPATSASAAIAVSPSWLSTPAVAPLSLASVVQRKVAIGPVNDGFEREADGVADRVASGVAVSGPAISRVPPATPAPVAQRKEKDEKEPDPHASDVPSVVQPKPAGGAAQPAMSAAAEHAIATKGAGAPLGTGVRGTLESRMGVDLGGVRVHSGPAASEATSALNARAFTHGRDVWLGGGENPGDTRLMAHEVTHVLQQDGVVRRKPADRPPAPDDDPERKPEEREPGDTMRAEAARATSPAPVVAPAGTNAADAAAVKLPTAPVVPPPAPGTERPATTATMLPSRSAPVALGDITAPMGESRAPAATPAPQVRVEEPVAPVAPGPAPVAEAVPSAAATSRAPLAPTSPAAAQAPAPVAPSTAAAVVAPAAPLARGPVSAATGAVPGPGPSPVPPAGAVDTGAGAPGPAPGPESDPRFRQVQLGIEKLARSERAHAPTAAKVGAAERATAQPAGEPLAKGMVAHTEHTATAAEHIAKPEEKSFEVLLEEALDRLTPKTPEDVEKLGESGAGGAALKAQVQSGVTAQAAQSAAPLEAANASAPAPTGAEVATPLPAETAGGAPAAVGAENVVPQPKPDADVSMDADRQQASGELAKTGLTEEQLANANEPSFNGALAARREVDENSAAAPVRYRAAEAGYLQTAARDAKGEEDRARANMRTARHVATQGARGKQEALRQQREAERQKVTADIQAMYTETKAGVDGRLGGLDGTVQAMFDDGQKSAFDALKANVARRLLAWKIARYGSRALIPLVGGLIAAGTWVYDKLRGIDAIPEVAATYTEERAAYVSAMKALFKRIAATVETALAACRDDIRTGRQRIAAYVDGLKGSLRGFAKDAQQRIGGEFDSLEQGVDAKKGQLAEGMAAKYKESRDAVDGFIAEERAANMGLLKRLVDAVGAVIETIRKLKERLAGILGKARGAMDIIIGDPIRFLANILDAVKLGFNQFLGNILEHLKAGLFGWMFGTLASAGIEMPKDFSLGSIFGLVLQVLGLTPAKMREKAVKLIGERAVSVLEKVWEFMSTLIGEGPAALWEKMKEYLGDLKDTIIEGVKEWVIANVVQAAVTKLVSMFNPVGAFIQAALAIYNTVMFFVERINQIIDLVETIVSSVYDIATGKIAQAANWVEQAMARTVPIIISFLARLLGLGGISEKIKAIVGKIQATVDKAIDALINKVVGMVKGLFAGKQEKPEPAKKSEPDQRSPQAKQADLDSAIAEAEPLLDGGTLTHEEISERLPAIRDKYRMNVLTLVVEKETDIGEVAHLHGELNPVFDGPGKKVNRDGVWKIDYGTTDTQGRPTGITATINKRLIGKGTGASSSIRPPGFKGGPANHARGHLLGRQLGGSGSERRNLVTLFHIPVNTPQMRGHENDLRAAVEKGEVVDYVVTPNYAHTRLMPTSVTLFATGKKADGTAGFALQKDLPNKE